MVSARSNCYCGILLYRLFGLVRCCEESLLRSLAFSCLPLLCELCALCVLCVILSSTSQSETLSLFYSFTLLLFHFFLSSLFILTVSPSSACTPHTLPPATLAFSIHPHTSS